MEIDNIYNMDCLEGMKQIPDGTIDCVITSPPYDDLRQYGGVADGWTFDKFKAIADQLVRVLRDGGICVWVIKDGTNKGFETLSSFKQAIYFDEIGLRLYDTMIWEKQSAPNPTSNRYYDVFEYMFIFSKDKPTTLNFICDHKNISVGKAEQKDSDTSNPESRRKREGVRICPEYSRRTNIWQIAVGQNTTGHPAVYPYKLALDHIRTWTNEQDVVLDPFMGSGTTAIACHRSKRHWIGFELNKEYFDKAVRRIKAEQAQLTLF